jgi:dinuclear metal center YbgI/SA1388 family protein
MKLAELEKFFESWAPRWTAWERDNVGIQIGRRSHTVRRVLIALDITPETINEAVRKRADTIISHHPLLFRPAKSLSDGDAVGTMALTLAEKKIALYSAHTNLDSAPDGVSFALARALGVATPKFLAPATNALVKLAVFVPHEYADKVAGAMAGAGAGIIGEYSSCSFRIEGKGTFRGSASSQPFSGVPRRLEEVEEIRLEMLVPRARVKSVVRAMKSVHPYDEVAYDIYTLENGDPNFGMGAIGTLDKPVKLSSFLSAIKKALRSESLRYSGDLRKEILTVAVCGGAGSELLDTAIAAGADALVTSDIRYHTFHAASGQIALVDAGHWETEQVVLPVIARRLKDWARAQKVPLDIILTKHRTNPIHSL